MFASETPAKAVDWWDFEFDKMAVPAVSTAGTSYRRNVAIGMPKIPPQVLYSTFGLYHSVEDARKGSNSGGTGFFVAYPTGEPSAPSLLYAVTNWHVAVQGGASVIRMNKIGGGVDIVDFDPSEWEFQPGGPDIAVIPHTMLRVRESIHEIVALHLGLFLTKIDVAQLGIGPGEDVFMLGRFVDHDRPDTNVPAARFGNISIMPQVIEQRTGAKNLESFILDVHSRTGYSGSPVFVYRTFGADLTVGALQGSTDVLGAIPLREEDHFIKLLGIHWGQFSERWEIETGKKVDAESVPLSADAKYVKGYSGMTLAVPAWTLREFLDMPKFRNARDIALNQILEARRARGFGDVPVAESSPPATDANPNHLKDFTRLVDAAARKRPQGGQT
jgi:hypothetical protein